jgi:ribonuclease HII
MLLPFAGENPNEIQVGVDEAGRGCLFGAVYAAAVVLPPIDMIPAEQRHELENIKDSKTVSKKKREHLRKWIEKHSLAYSVAFSDNHLIDSINILHATLDAMHRAIDGISVRFDRIIVDGNRFEPYVRKNGEFAFAPHTCVIGGDNKYLSIAAASILAKTYHDDHIHQLVDQHPDLGKYGLLQHVGYGTSKHREAIALYGPSPFHRMTFGPCKNAPNSRDEESTHYIKI